MYDTNTYDLIWYQVKIGFLGMSDFSIVVMVEMFGFFF